MENIVRMMVFDVESVGLHGEGFAVGWVVITESGEVVEERRLSCDPAHAAGSDEGRAWVALNVPPLPITSPTPEHLRTAFWEAWRKWAGQGVILVADCVWPVETNFLSACVAGHPEREWWGPYPLYDLASLLGLSGAAITTDRLPSEMPAHDPLMDARQSARQLLAFMKEREVRLGAT